MSHNILITPPVEIAYLKDLLADIARYRLTNATEVYAEIAQRIKDLEYELEMSDQKGQHEGENS
jgi:hypothetical protein